MSDQQTQRIGAKKFILLHHDGCFRSAFHYRVHKDGAITRLASDDHRTQHPHAIAVQLEGNFDQDRTSKKQIDALKQLLLELKMRYPSVEIGAHRQVRGDKRTTCPGKYFPLSELRAWATSHLLDERDELIRETIESQYRP